MSDRFNTDAKDAKGPQKTQKVDGGGLAHEDDLSHQIIGCAVEVQRELGVGLLEGAYRKAMIYELQAAGLRVESEVGFTASYRGHDLGLAYRADLIVEGAVVVELKCVEALQDVHRAQLLTYLRLSGLRLGLLLNFNDLPVAKGVKRMVNKL